MKVTQLFEEDGLRTFLLVMDKGDEAFEQITGFAERERITAASPPMGEPCSAQHVERKRKAHPPM